MIVESHTHTHTHTHTHARMHTHTHIHTYRKTNYGVAAELGLSTELRGRTHSSPSPQNPSETPPHTQARVLKVTNPRLLTTSKVRCFFYYYYYYC
jgi:hypothetical protein